MRSGIKSNMAHRVELAALPLFQHINDPGFDDQASHTMADQNDIAIVSELGLIGGIPDATKHFDARNGLTKRCTSHRVKEISIQTWLQMRWIFPHKQTEVS